MYSKSESHKIKNPGERMKRKPTISPGVYSYKSNRSTPIISNYLGVFLPFNCVSSFLLFSSSSSCSFFLFSYNRRKIKLGFKMKSNRRKKKIFGKKQELIIMQMILVKRRRRMRKVKELRYQEKKEEARRRRICQLYKLRCERII